MASFNPADTSNMRRCFFPPNDPTYQSDRFAFGALKICEGKESTVSLFYYLPDKPFDINKIRTVLGFDVWDWWIVGPTGPAGYYPVLIKESGLDANCQARDLVGGNSLIDTNKYVWACLTSKPPKVIPDQVFYANYLEYTVIKIQLEDSRGDRIPESVSVRGAVNWRTSPFTSSDLLYSQHGLKFEYNNRPLGFAPGNPNLWQPSDGLGGDNAIIYGYPKLEGTHSFTVKAFNSFGTSEEKITVVVRKRGVTISLMDWGANFNVFEGATSPYRKIRVFGYGMRTSHLNPAGELFVSTTKSPETPENIWQVTNALDGSDAPNESNWSDGFLLPKNAGDAVDATVYVRALGPSSAPEGVTEYKGFVEATAPNGLINAMYPGSPSASQPLNSLVFGIDLQLFGDHLFTSVFPLYCNVATAGQKSINRKAIEDGDSSQMYVSVNGADPFEITADTKLPLTAGWNRVVFVYTNTSGPVAQFVLDDIQDVTSWWSPNSLKACIGKTVSQCIPAVTSSSGLENLAKGMLFYNMGRESALNIEQNAFPYMPLNQKDFPFSIVGEGYRAQPYLRDILHYHNDFGVFSNNLKTQSLPGYDYIIRPDITRNKLEFYHDIRTGASPDVSPITPWNLTRDTATKCRMVYFRVNMAAQIRQGTFSTSSHTVELRGEFSGWGPIPGVLLPIDNSTQNSTVYHFLAYIQGDPGATLKYKFKATSSLDWEKGGDRTLQLGPISDQNKTLQVVPPATFNNAVSAPLLLGSNKPLSCFIGSSPVSKIYYENFQVYP